ncbi:MAG TPA: hypothetical protein P5108_03370 [Marmoricola sp.]|jgi:hypothetical protein|nr:hypothetical protein [Nocardioidaceae bacterium]MCB8993549.1 hypothetical protein [Nocardioidaceae bacterium]MCO5323362.1 hypothetical protein [Nocardioidaceae bacterium]HRV68466.1 hypothetical protein [Marmoricola sp.]
MYGSTKNDPAPPEVPKEFAETYRQAFAKAMAGMGQTPHVDPPRVVPVQREADGPTTATYVPTRPDTQGVRISGPLFADHVGKRGAGFWAQLRSSALFVPVIVAFAALLVVGSAYLIGALGSSGIGERGQTTSSMADAAYDGPVTWQHGLSVDGDCGAAKQVAGQGPKRAVDGRSATAWTCRGEGEAMLLTVRMPKTKSIGQVGLIPGHAAQANRLGANHFASGNRITKVRWHLADVKIDQDIPDNRFDRSVRTIRIPATTARVIKVEILDVARGKRNQTSISEVVVGAAR